MRLQHPLRRLSTALTPLFAALVLAPAGHAATSVVGYESEADLEAAVAASGGRVVRTIPRLQVAEVSAVDRHALAGEGIDFVQGVSRRVSAAEPALAPWAASPAPFANAPYQWQWAATRADAVPDAVLRAARG